MALASRALRVARQFRSAWSCTSLIPHNFGSKQADVSSYILAACLAAAVGSDVIASDGDGFVCGNKRADLPTFSASDIAKHDRADTGIWVAYKEGVYDVTSFLQQHPGGAEKLMLAAGKQIDPFWALYAQHKAENVQRLLETLRIGNVDAQSFAKQTASNASSDPADPYRAEPSRHPGLVVNSQQPFNAETPQEMIVDSFITPNSIFYKRNHMPVPTITPDEYRLHIEVPTSIGRRTLSLSLADLGKLPQAKVVATLQCAGNRRSDIADVKPVRGLNWRLGAIGNAEWRGVYLRDVLKAAGVQDAQGAKHVHFEGLDADPTGTVYGSSIPIETALSASGDVLLATHMNGEPLLPDHGYPVRALVPGTVAARSVKWLGKVVVDEFESNSHWQQRDYRGFSPNVDWHNVDFSTSPSIQELPVTSAITSPRAGTVFDPSEGSISLQGYAWSGGGRAVVRVDVSIDGGKTWHTADLNDKAAAHADSQPYGRVWSWMPWEIEIDLPEDTPSELQLVCKATDRSYNTQPQEASSVWNLRGVLSTAWHRITIQAK